jgi:hypothetical protein
LFEQNPDADKVQRYDELHRKISGETGVANPLWMKNNFQSWIKSPKAKALRPEIEEFLRLGEHFDKSGSFYSGTNPQSTGGQFMENIANSRPEAAAKLRAAGIPGVKYHDQGSRKLAQGAKSHNYVAFDDKMIRILRKYGIAGVPAAGVAAGAAQQDDQRARGGGVSAALKVAREVRRANGGAVHVGPIVGKTGGRADEVPMEVPDGSYVLTADHCSAMGQGNTLAGFEKLKKMFPKSAAAFKAAKAAGPRTRARGGRVPIYAAHGEFVICPEDIKDRYGDLDHGHKVLDHWQTMDRQKHIDTLSKLAPPAQD